MMHDRMERELNDLVSLKHKSLADSPTIFPTSFPILDLFYTNCYDMCIYGYILCARACMRTLKNRNSSKRSPRCRARAKIPTNRRSSSSFPVVAFLKSLSYQFRVNLQVLQLQRKIDELVMQHSQALDSKNAQIIKAVRS